MKKFIIIGIVILISSCSSVKKLSNKDLKLIGTTWSYKDDTHSWLYDITFLKEGKLQTTHPNDKTPDNDFWSRDGKILKFSYNDEFSNYQGEFVDKNKIHGTAKSKNGQTWKWILTKK